MDVVLHIIGIIMLISKPAPPAQLAWYEVRVPNGRIEQQVCGGTPLHYAFIRTTVANVKESSWPWIPCNDGDNCQLFPLDGDILDIDPITSGSAITGSADKLPHMDDGFAMGPLESNLDADTVGQLAVHTGLVKVRKENNGMKTVVITATLPQLQDITIKSSMGRTITIPKAGRTVTIDLVNLPIDDALGVPGANTAGADRSHFMLHYLFAQTKPSLAMCGAPSDPQTAAIPLAHGTRMRAAGGGSGSVTAAASIDCSSSTYP